MQNSREGAIVAVPGEIVVVVRRAIESKSRYIPFVTKSTDAHGRVRCRIESMAEPTTALLEAYIAGRCRKAVRAHERDVGPWPKDARYEVDIELGEVIQDRNADVDNVAKVILDGMNHVVFDEDRQVDRLTIDRGASGSKTARSGSGRRPTTVRVRLRTTEKGRCSDGG